MIKRIIKEIDKIPRLSKSIVFIGVGTGLILLCAALGLNGLRGACLSHKYMSERIAKTAVTVFAQGVVFGLGADFLLRK